VPIALGKCLLLWGGKSCSREVPIALGKCLLLWGNVASLLYILLWEVPLTLGKCLLLCLRLLLWGSVCCSASFALGICSGELVCSGEMLLPCSTSCSGKCLLLWGSVCCSVCVFYSGEVSVVMRLLLWGEVALGN